MPKRPSSTHELTLIPGRPPRLHEADAPLDALQELPRHLVAHDMRLTLMQLLSRRPLVNANHSYSNRPRSVTR